MNRDALVPIGIVLAGFAAAALLIATGPEVEPRRPELTAPLVRVVEVSPQTLQLRVSTHGTVVPRTESALVPEVSGRVIMGVIPFALVGAIGGHLFMKSFGLLPLMLNRSVQAQFLVPMAISLAFGVLAATLVTLLVVPAGYWILEDLRRLGRKPEPKPAALAA
jgi:hypothetical protein